MADENLNVTNTTTIQVDLTTEVSAAVNVTIDTIDPELQPSVDAANEAADRAESAAENAEGLLETKLDISDFNNISAQNLGLLNNSDESFNIVDDNGNIAFQVDPEGNTRYNNQVTPNDLEDFAKTDQIAEEIAEIGITTQEDDTLIICDKQGYVIFEAKASGVNYIGKSQGGSNGEYPYPNYPSGIALVINYGQSLSKSGSITSDDDYFDSKTFAGGINTGYSPDDAAAKATYFGTQFRDLPKQGADYGKPILKIIKSLIASQNNVAVADQGFTLVTASPGEGGASWSALSNVTGIYYRRLLDLVRYGKDYAIALGQTFSCPVVTWIQGENTGDKNKTQQQYFDNLVTLFTSLNNDIKAITGQAEDVQFITYQTASFGRNSGSTGVPLAFLKAANELENVHLGAVMYQYNYADAVHLANTSYRNMYANIGAVAKKVVIDGEKWNHIYPENHFIQSNSSSNKWVLSIKMKVPVKPLVFDESINSRFTTPPTNKGFSILNAGTEIISSVSVSQGDTINIVTNQNPVGLTLTYAIQGAVSGGNLRDSQGDFIKISQSDLEGRVDNWCPIFSYLIN